MKTQIVVETVMENHAKRRMSNQPKLTDIEFVYNGEVVEIDSKELEEFRFTGLSNIDFVTTRDWD